MASSQTKPTEPLFDAERDELVGRLAEDMARRWQAGERPLAEQFFETHPELWQHPEAAAELIYEEFCLRQQHGVAASAADLYRRFPQWRMQLEVLLHCHRLLEPAAASLPEVGESLGDFHLLAELGRGGQGRVFLATQRSLADRPVVLKCTALEGEEHLSLARLQHTHIVPLYTVQHDPERQLRTLVMPFFGGATLADLLTALQGLPVADRSGRDLLQALDLAQAERPVTLTIQGPARRLLAESSYVHAICWIGACVAEALQYAHARQLVHLDVKPSNVLLAADGQPMLLDFHLAREPIYPGGASPRWLGGTTGWMSPEQEAALAALGQDRPVPQAVDVRSDVYSLGLVLYAALGGTVPLPTSAPTPLHDCNPKVTPGLSDLVARCLARAPRDRYPNAGAVLADLRHHLAHQPLEGVPNRSWKERWRKWRRRQPRGRPLVLLALVLAALVGGTALLGYTLVRHQLDAARSALAEGRAALYRREFTEAVTRLQRGLLTARNLPGGQSVVQELERELERAEQGALRQDLHTQAERLRLLSALAAPTAAQRETAAAFFAQHWSRRADLRPSLNSENDGERLRTDLLDLALLASDLQVRFTQEADQPAARRQALRVLDEAEALLGSQPVIDHERQRHATALGDTRLADLAAARLAQGVPHTAQEHFALGRAMLQAGELKPAALHLEHALQLRPQGAWPNFYRGLCAWQSRQYQDAVSAFTACVAQAPESALFRYYRALAQQALGRPDRALRDLDAALRLDPDLAIAALQRGILHLEGKRYAQATSDLQRALALGADPAAGHYRLAQVQLAQNERDAARFSLQQALQFQPQHAEARKLLDQLQREP
ncbi:MAG: protein kinase [Planctomycetia bacterium]|nr:protein kinase [Planctomycetia bacterium]